jgi:NADPH:quinone reductase-like Zn-dependent oxidoreductase
VVVISLLDVQRCDEVICSTREDLVVHVKQITGGAGAAAVIDSVGGEQMAQLAAAVRDDGNVWLYGLMDGLTFTGNGPEVLFRWGGEPGSCCHVITVCWNLQVKLY